MTLPVKDATGATVNLKSTTDTGEQVPNHIVDTGSGAGATIGTTADAAVDTDTTGTLSGKIRGIVKLLVAMTAKLPSSIGAKGPSSSLSVSHPLDVLFSGSFTALNQVVALTATGEGESTLLMAVSGTWAGSVVVEASQDGGTVWEALPLLFINGGTVTGATSTNGLVMAEISGVKQVRIRCSIYTSGTIVFNGYTSQGSFSHYMQSFYNIGINTLNTTTVLGTTADAAVTTNTTGSLSGKLRGIVAILASVWDSTNAWFRVVASSKTVTLKASPTLSSGASIVSGDFVGLNTTPWSWANAVRSGVLTGTLQTVVVADQSLQAIPMELWLFEATVTVPNDSAAWNLSDADSFKCIGVIDLPSWRSSTLNSICTVPGIGLAFTLTSTTLYGALVAKGTATFGTNALQVTVTILQD